MQPAHTPSQRPPDARLLVVDAQGLMHHAARTDLPLWLKPGDLLVANDAATLPASLSGHHVPSGAAVEVRLAGHGSLAPDAVSEFKAIVFGAGDYRTRTEERPLPPLMQPGDELVLGPLRAVVLRVQGHPRLIALSFRGTPDAIRAGIARHGRPIQYAHVAQPLELWDVWTRIAAVPAAFEPPSAGFLLDWNLLAQLHRCGVGFATLTHAAGISSTGDPQLDARLPFDEPYLLPAATVETIERTRANHGRVVALGTTVVRALEHAAARRGGLAAGADLATQRIGPHTRLRVVDAIVTGNHEPGSSHYELLRAFAAGERLERITAELEQRAYRTHEFGDSLLLMREFPTNARTVRTAASRACAPV